ncbi:MAG: TRAP transporter large permease subunit [Acidobacteriota bacterium]|nr:TRAP transporter large permease subunit [Acidobacteriota bacterium]
MSETIPLEAAIGMPVGEELQPARLHRRLEEYGLVLMFAALATLPIAEIVLRKIAGVGISGSATLVQHLTLIVSMLGAALAARDGRLLSLATATLLKGRARTAAAIVSGSVAASVTAFLAIGSLQFALTERGGATLAYSIPLWVVQLILPIGFAVVALRLVWRASQRWSGRIVAAFCTAAICIVLSRLPISAEHLSTPAFVILLIAAILGAPIFVILGGTALILFWRASIPIAAVAVGHYGLVVNPSIPAIPLFTLAGFLLAEGGASKRLVAVFTALFSRVRGGPAIITALACAFFTSFTGGSGVTILALGGLLLPVLLGAGYSKRDSLGLITGAGSLGLLFPPCLPLILYAIVAQVPMERMFLGGILPGIVMLILTAVWGIRRDPGSRKTTESSEISATRALWEAKWELLLPVAVIVVLFSGLATPVETAAFTVLYAFVVEVIIHRDYKSFAKLASVFTEAGLLIGGVLLILGVALGLTSFLVDMEIPTRAVQWATGSIHSRFAFLLLLNGFLLVVGAIMDIFPAIVVVAPLVAPLGVAFGIDPTHMGIIFLANLELGFLMPPIGLNLLISSYRFGVPIGQVYRATLPMIFVLLAGVLLITYVPSLTTFLPNVFAR